MLHPNSTRAEIAAKMGISRSGLNDIVKQGRDTGLLVFDDPMDQIEYEIIPKVLDNLNFYLDAKDKAVTIEAAKGTIFRSYQEARGISENNQTVIALKIETAGGPDVKVMTGHIVGKPKGLPAQIVEIEEVN